LKVYRFAILSFAHLHAYSYATVIRNLPNTELVAIFDDNRERLYEVGRRFGVDKLYYDYEELLRKEELDAVIVTSENARHREMVTVATERGVHVLCEKPIATSLKDADEMIASAERAGVKLQIAFVMRYHPATVKVKEIVDAGEIGKILTITSTNHGKYPGGWFGIPELSGGGAIMDHTVHVADLMRWYTGSEVVEVHAYVGENIRSYLRCEDCALISLRFKDGTIASIDCSWSRPDEWPIWGDVFLQIIGTEGCIVVDAFRSAVHYAGGGTPLTWASFGTNPDEEMIKHFVKVIEEDLEPRASGVDGRKALEIALAAYLSNERGRPIELPLR